MKKVSILKLIFCSILISLVVYSYSSNNKLNFNSRSNCIAKSHNIEKREYPKSKGCDRIISYNIRHCETNTKGLDYNEFAKIITLLNPDIICLQEVDCKTKRSNGVDQAKKLGELTNMYSTFSASIDFNNGEYGVAILSKEKPIKTHRISLPGVEKRSALFVEFKNYIVINTHFALQEENREESFQLIENETEKYDNLGERGEGSKPIILCGDLNESDLNSSMFNYAKKYWEIDSSVKKTYPTPIAKTRIDFILTYKKNNKGIKCKYTDVVTKLNNADVAEASDHFPILCDYKF